MNIGPLSGSLFGAATPVRPYIPLKTGAVEAFADEIARRASQTPAAEGAERSVGGEGLSSAVEDAVDYVRERHGDQAARAVMGIVLSRAGDGPVSEDALGQGFVDALEFIDRQFGVASGDQAIARFNGALNKAINGFYQNGHEESFMVQGAEQASQGVAVATNIAVSGLAGNFADQQDDQDSSLLEQALENTEAFLAAGKEEEYPLTPGGTDPLDAALDASPASAAGTTGLGLARLASRSLSAYAGRSGLAPGLVLDASA
ncbi:hypothetical protein NNJEOMEG_03544 [Fundidesulfovibrio magnetotacticus]|uniref:Uncharacterized protein n=1 Tax=Fundidesulfovibrio magnetotacticus TaxID=2730080 RepID=A0A6V8M0Z5_9BACT|nr:hypothetical protein [Fundidesulfovibrio magnetotacticus]GFK95676.1 hypothetical protein NNJEOMEG_03544 [Fundidesulfovibrio magnetotacticus]